MLTILRLDFMLVTTVIIFDSSWSSRCKDNPFLDVCIQRKNFQIRNSSYLLTTVTISECKIENFTGSLVLIDVYVSNASLKDLANTTQPLGIENACLTQQFRRDLTGYTRIGNQQAQLGRCHVTSKTGYIILEYMCIPYKQALQIPQCPSTINESRVHIQNEGFPNTGIAINRQHNSCNCTISTRSNVLNITIYYMDLTDKQSLTILDGRDTGYKSKNLLFSDMTESHSLSVRGTLSLQLVNKETGSNSSKFWIQLKADNENIEVSCLTKIITTTAVTSSLAFDSTPSGTTDGHHTISVTTKTSPNPKSPSKAFSTLFDFSTEGLPNNGFVSKPTYVSQTTFEGTASSSKNLTRSSIAETSTLSTSAEDAEPASGNENSKLPIIIGVVVVLVSLVVVVVIIVVAINRHKKRKMKEKEAENLPEGSAATTDDETVVNDSLFGTADEPLNTKFYLSSAMVPATRFPPLQTQFNNANHSTGQHNTEIDDDLGQTTDKKKRKKKKKKKKKRKNSVYPEENRDYEIENRETMA